MRLEKAGYVVDTAADGVEGLDKAMDMAFDLIVLDLALPLRDGLDVCRDLRQAGIATPILMLTARTQTADKIVGLKLGADDYVTKPFSSAELLARIEALLRRVPFRTGQGILESGFAPPRYASHGSYQGRQSGLSYGSRISASSLFNGESRERGSACRTLAIGLGV